MTRTIRPLLDDELTNLLHEAGGRKVVLVEGPDDVEIFDDWYAERLDDVMFHAAIGHGRVTKLLNKALAYAQKDEFYGVIDRDFRDDTDVELSYDSASHLFILRRYCLENYLLEPPAVHAVARTFHGKSLLGNVKAVEAEMLRICDEIATIVAMNAALVGNARERLSDGHAVLSRDRFHAIRRRPINYLPRMKRTFGKA